jgi:hypothetical protein
MMLISVFKGQFLGSDGQSPADDRGDLFDPRPLHVTFIMGKVALGQSFLQIFRFSLVSIILPMSVSFHQCQYHSTNVSIIPPMSVSFHQFSLFFHVATALLGQGLLDRTPVS